MDTGMDREWLWYWLGSIPGVGIKKIKQLLGHFSDVAAIERASREELEKVAGLNEKDRENLSSQRQKERAEKEFLQWQGKGISCCTYGSRDYPACLKELYQPPKILYVKGRMPDSGKLSISIVGARDCSCYGRDMARMFAYRLAQAGVQIVSGMALGIDGWAHQGALEAGGDTFAVLGSGVEVCYPAEHGPLYRSLCRRGGVISEFPPDTRAKPQFFPLRNRIISGFSQGILVVEARERSGSLITADAALEQGRDVFAVPGRIGDVLSNGCNRLIRQGATPVLSPLDILEYYDQSTSIIEETRTVLEEKVLRSIGEIPVHMDWLQSTLKEGRADVFKAVLKLRSEGKIREVSRDYFVRV